MAGNVPNCDWQEQSHILSNLGNPITTQISADSLSKVTAQFESLLNCTTNIPGRLFSVGFSFSAFPARHAGFRPILRVPRYQQPAANSADFPTVRFFSALCSQKIVENRIHLAHAERLCSQ